MANDDEWLEDVRRWYFGGSPPATDADTAAIGYEAAQPAVQARHWPDPPQPLADKPT
jgi:hypothetical protein